MNPYLFGGTVVVILCIAALFLVWYDGDPPDDPGDDYWGV